MISYCFRSGRLFVAVCIGLAICAASQAQGSTAPDDVAAWGLHCFCLGARATPHAIIKLDNNGRILYAARKGATIADLGRAGIAATQSQLRLLIEYGLLEQEGAAYTTSFPLVGPAETAALRSKLVPAAKDLARRITPHARSISQSLHEQGLDASVYAIVFGLALDGLLWEVLNADHALPSTDVDIDHPHWQGAFWAVYPERSGAPGTNQVTEGSVALTLTWTDTVATRLHALETSKDLPRALRSIASGEVPSAPVSGTDGKAWRLAESGKLVIPVVHRRAGDPLYDPSLALARIVARALQEDVAIRAAAASLDKASRSEGTLILAHEFIWDLIDELVREGTVPRPRALDEASGNTDDLRALLFVIR